MTVYLLGIVVNKNPVTGARELGRARTVFVTSFRPVGVEFAGPAEGNTLGFRAVTGGIAPVDGGRYVWVVSQVRVISCVLMDVLLYSPRRGVQSWGCRELMG